MKNLIFPIGILLAAVVALVFPNVFTQLGNFPLTQLIVPLLMLIMFGMGTSLSFGDFKRVVSMPKNVGIGLLCQYTIMPILGFSLAVMSGLPAEIAAGVILVGCSPGGLASNVMAYISGANLALSLTLTAFSTLLAPFLTPMLMSLLADHFVEIDAFQMFWSISKIVILPVVAGLLFHHFLSQRVPILNTIMPIVSMLGIVVVIAIITAAGRDSLLSIGLILIAVVIIHNVAGILIGYVAAKLINMSESDARAIAFEVGMQNSGLASGIAVSLGKVATLGLAPALFGPFMNIFGSLVASYWRANGSLKSLQEVKTQQVDNN
ncbi:MAG: bile acid:sodium symporter family protein [Pseudomonadota bacterium]